LKGTKFGCGQSFLRGLYGALGRHCNSILRHADSPRSVPERSPRIEAVAATKTGRAVREAWLAADVVQCGYCQAGQIMSASALLSKNPKPTDGRHRIEPWRAIFAVAPLTTRIRMAIKASRRAVRRWTPGTETV